jgi:hypothetical protein
MSCGARALALLLAPLALAACTTSGATVYTARFPLLSTRTSPLFGYALEGAPRTEDVEVELRAHTILWVPTRTDPPTLEEAVDEVLRRGNGTVLLDAVVDHWWWYVPPFYGQEGWRVRGDVVDARKADEGAATAEPAPEPPSAEPYP